MHGRIWRAVRRLAAGSCTALLLAAGAAHAEDTDLAELKARLERLEKQNEYLQKSLGRGVEPASATAANKTEVEQIVAEYLQAQDTKKKAEEAKAKKADEDKGAEVGKDTTFRVLYRDGVHFETADRAFRAALRGRWHNDWGWNQADPQVFEDAPFNAVPAPLEDGTIFRRARLGIQGSIWEVHDFVAEFEFAGGTINFREVWMGVNQLPVLGTVRAGHFKEPFSLEQLTSSRFLTFIERSILDGPVDDNMAYNTGIMANRTFHDDAVGVASGVFRQTDATGNDLGDGDYQFTNRGWISPVYEHDGRCVLHLAAAWSHRQPATTGIEATAPDDQVLFRTRPYRIDPRTFLSTGLFECEHYDAFGYEAAAVIGPLSLQAELHQYEIANSFTGAGAGRVSRGDASFYGYYMYASYFLTGENRNYNRIYGNFGRVKPFENFWAVNTSEDDCGGLCCGSGAWEVAARWAHLDLTDGNIGIPGMGFSGTGMLDQFTLGLNWYWNPNMKVQLNYEWLDLDRNGTAFASRDANDGEVRTVVVRFAWDF